MTGTTSATAAALAALAIAAVAVALGCAGGGNGGASETGVGPVHVHGLGVNPADGALFIATHTGLFRSGEGESKSVRVGDSFQDTMGFAVAGENRFIGSGHPDLRQDLPPLLGLIESTDAGKSWHSISLSGDADFHVLRSAGQNVYGYDASNDRLLASSDAGRTWSEVERPVPLVDLTIDPSDSKRLIAAGVSDFEQGLYESRDGGLSWERIGEEVGLLSWPDSRHLFLVDAAGRFFGSNDNGIRFAQRGEIGGQPAALLAQGPDELYAALHDGTIKKSEDGGATWTVRSTP
jgi:Sortilin, neurotensin receptor 3,